MKTKKKQSSKKHSSRSPRSKLAIVALAVLLLGCTPAATQMYVKKQYGTTGQVFALEQTSTGVWAPSANGKQAASGSQNATAQAPPAPAAATPAPTVSAGASQSAAQKPKAAPKPAAPAPAPAPQTVLETSSSLSFINTVRAEAGKPPLAGSSVMDQWALEHAKVLASTCTLYHQSLGQFLGRNIGPTSVSSIAENVGYAGTTAKVLTALKNSPGHYANMIGDYQYVGIGVVGATGGCAGYVYTTQLFAR